MTLAAGIPQKDACRLCLIHNIYLFITMRHHFNLSLMTAMLAVCSLTACVTDEEYGNSPSDNTADGRIRFVPMEFGREATRGAQTEAGDITYYGVSCAVCPVTDTYTTVGCGSYFYNEQMAAAAGTSKYYWPGSNYKLSFYAYTPYGNSNLTLTSLATKTGFPTYNYTVPQGTAAQVDVMTADTLDVVATATTTPIRLYFRHRLTDLRFKVRNQHPTQSLTVKSISVAGMKYTGTWENPAWTLTGQANTVSSYPLTYNATTAVAAGATVDITGDNNHFMVLPQTIASGTTFLKVMTSEYGSDRTYTHILDNDLILTMSKSYSFTLVLGDGELTVDTDNPEVYDWEPTVVYVTNSGVDARNPEYEGQNIGAGTVGVNDWQ